LRIVAVSVGIAIEAMENEQQRWTRAGRGTIREDVELHPAEIDFLLVGTRGDRRRIRPSPEIKPAANAAAKIRMGGDLNFACL
jgi:hypothetical protein